MNAAPSILNPADRRRARRTTHQPIGRGVISITVASGVPELGLFDLIASASEPLSVDRDVEATDVQQKDQIEDDQSER